MPRVETMVKPSVQGQHNGDPVLSTLNQACPASITMKALYCVVAGDEALTNSLELRALLMVTAGMFEECWPATGAINDVRLFCLPWKLACYKKPIT